MKRLLDVVLSLVLAVTTVFPMIIIAMLVRMSSPGPAIYRTKRVGINNTTFTMYKFRTMRTDTPAVATHLMNNPGQYLTPVGRFLRKTSLDELPQVYNILKGDMSFVGPRPALYNQDDLIALRTERGIHMLPPGLTGWAQINGRDELPIPVKVEYDYYYLMHRSMLLDLKIIAMTALKVLQKDGVSH